MKSNLLLFACPEMHISSGHRPILWAFGGNSSVNCGFANMGMKRFHCVYCNARNKMFYSPDNKTINANMKQDPAKSVLAESENSWKVAAGIYIIRFRCG